MNRVVALMSEMVNAVNAGDVARYGAVYEPDARVVIHGGGALTGRLAIEEHERQRLAQFPRTRFAVTNIWVAPQTTIARYGVNSPATSKMPATGHEGLLFFDISPSGLIAEEHRYLDSLTPAVQAGAFPTLAARSIPILAATPSVFEMRIGGGGPTDGAGLLGEIDSAMLARDVDTFARCFTDEGEIDDLTRPRVDAGPGGIRQWFTTWCGAFDDVAVESTRSVTLDNIELREDVVRATMTNSWSGVGGHERATRTITLHRGRIAQIDGGRIVRLTHFVNRRELQG